jgi:phenylalanyl-tRNA synthetase beta chain
VIDILERLGFHVKALRAHVAGRKEEVLHVVVPEWRPVKDISIPEDLVEEVARIYGYDNIKTELPMFPITPPEQNKLRLLERKIKELVSLEHGFTEVYNYSFVSPITLEKLELPLESFVELDNPVAKDRPYLRHNLWTGLAETLEKNLHQFACVKIFEIGKVFIKDKSGMRAKANGDELLPAQPTYLGLAYAEKGVETPFYCVSEALTAVLRRLGCVVELRPAEHELGKFIHAGRQAQVLVNGIGIGAISELSPQFAERLGIDTRVGFAELDLDLLLPLISDNIQYHKIPQYPSVVRDIAFVVDKKVTHQSIVAALSSVSPLIRNVELFDIFPSAGSGQVAGKIPEGKKSMAYHIIYRSDEKTLEAGDMEKAHSKVIEVIEDKFGGEVRM